MATHVSVDGGEHGPVTMGYYTRADLPFYYALADAFTVCDAYFSSVIGPTDPNRVMSMSGTIDPARDGGRAGGRDVRQPDRGVRQTDLGDDAATAAGRRGELEGLQRPALRAGADPGCPTSRPSPTRSRSPASNWSAEASPRTSRTISRRTSGGTSCRRCRGSCRRWHSASIPPRRPVTARTSSTACSRTLVANPAVWAQTVLFVTHDENGGFFDHVPPLTPPPGTEGEWLTGTLPAAAGGIDGPVGLGLPRRPAWSSRRSAGAATCARRRSTTPRCCASSRPGSASRCPTCRHGGAA